MNETEYALGTHCGVTFAGIKAASLFNLKRRCAHCLGRYEEYFARRGFVFLTMKSDDERILLYVYNRKRLEGILFERENRRFLEGEGYRYETAEEALTILKSRMNGEDFPHEIGIFLHYPLEDVKGFIAHPNEGVKLIGCWKVYEGEERKKRIFEIYKKCTQRIIERLSDGIPLESIFCKTVSDVAALKRAEVI